MEGNRKAVPRRNLNLMVGKKLCKNVPQEFKPRYFQNKSVEV